MREGGLPDEYKAMQLDFHWGSADHNGSEHLINGTQFPMEVISQFAGYKLSLNFFFMFIFIIYWNLIITLVYL